MDSVKQCMHPVRSALFVPGNRADRIDKALASQADVVIIDLEDAVLPENKTEARGIAASKTANSPGRRVWVRCNTIDSGLCWQDLEAFAQNPPECFLLPKTDSPRAVWGANALLAALEIKAGKEPDSIGLIGLIESAAAVAGLACIAETARETARLKTFAFGAADYSLDMGFSLSDSGVELAYPRSLLPLVCRQYGLAPPIDTPYMLDLSDEAKFAADAERGKCLGFQGKLLIHPKQVFSCNQVFSPSAEEVAAARKIIEAFRQAQAANQGAAQVDGKFIDRPVVEKAERILLAAQNV